jgi:hypothetical protein
MNTRTTINNLSRLAALSFVCFMFSFYLINEAVWGYGFLIGGVALAIVDIILKRKRDKAKHTYHQPTE